MKSRTGILVASGPAVALALALVLAGCQGGGHAGHGDHDEHAHEEMAGEHPMTESHPGVTEAVQKGEPVYYCPMHPEVIEITEGAKCQKCGDMVLVRHEGEVYHCPMHPDQVTADRAARCAECRMQLEKIEPLAAEEPAPGS